MNLLRTRHIALLGAFSMLGCAHSGTNPHEGSLSEDAPGAGESAVAELVPLNGSAVSGVVTFVQLADGGVKVEGHVFGLSPVGLHGFHVHENGNCGSVDGSTAGGHFNPSKKSHGDPASPNSHVGDLGNVQADSNGLANVLVVKKEATLSHGENAFVGHSIIIHKMKDDMSSQPAGASGDRIACGVIRRKT